MSDDISLAQPPRRMTDGGAVSRPRRVPDDPGDVRPQGLSDGHGDWRPQGLSDGYGDWRLWDLYFAVTFVVVVTFVLVVDQGEPVRERVIVSALVTAMAAWYVGFGRRLIGSRIEDWRNIAFQLGLVALYLPAIFMIESTSFVLFALCPLAYMSLPMIPASAVVVLSSLALPASVLVTTGDLRATVMAPLPVSLVIIAFSTVIAVTITRTERRSAERAALIEELASTRAEVARLSREAGVADERQRLAGEIHDTVAQGLSSVVMLVQAADAAIGTDPDTARAHLGLAARTARENLEEARAMVGALTPAPLSKSSLVDAVRRLTERFTAEAGIPVRFTVDGDARPMPTGAEVVLLRVAQEALNNVRKHAGAQQVAVRLAFTGSDASAHVSDDGCGFDVDENATGYGLDAMRGRVEQVGGRFSIRSRVGHGTEIEAEIDA